MDVNWVLIGTITLGWLVFLIIAITWLSRTALRRNIFASAGRKMTAIAMPLSLLIGTLAGALAYAAYGRQLSYVAGAFYVAHGVSFVLLVMGLMSLRSPALEAPVLTTFQKRWMKIAQDCGLGVKAPFYLRLGHKHAAGPVIEVDVLIEGLMAPSGLLLDTGTALLGYERRIAELDYAFVHMNDMPDGPPDTDTAVALLEQWGYSPGHVPDPE